MKVIFTDHVSGVASRGDVKNVKRGFFRNYLLPYHKAVAATELLLKEWDERRKRMLIEKEQLKTKLSEIKRRLSESKLRIEKKVTKKKTLYGGVKASDIVKSIASQLNLEVPEEAIQIKTQIKAVGTFEVNLSLGEGIQTTIPLEVVEKV